ncbi:hypothetical protein [Agriterribacter humi]|uniref:hypothetical protein n=1 Tax=Agriterribacter humi TaxID=1104781 RepID=UPI0012645EA5|nr:hypothetical protein [Agriterribacter humi]
MTIGAVRILSFLKNSQLSNNIDVDIAVGVNLTVSEVIHFASNLEQEKYIIDVSNEYQQNLGVKSWLITNEGIIKLKEIESIPQKEKLDKISKSDGTFICRPANQDITPKAFEVNPVVMVAGFETPTERRMLWMIAHYPYLLNSFFLDDLGRDSLKLKHYIKQSEDNIAYYITIKGQLHRLTSHPQWIFIQLLLAAFLALIVGIIIKKW